MFILIWGSGAIFNAQHGGFAKSPVKDKQLSLTPNENGPTFLVTFAV